MKLFRRNLVRLTRAPLPPEAKDDPIHVRIRDLHKSYGEHHVLKGVSLDIHRGKTNLIIGPSGSGKTVLMRQLIRLENPDSGQLIVNGIDFAQLEGLDLAAMRRTFGMVFQMSALFDSMTVFDNVAFPLREHTDLSRNAVRDRVMDRLAALGVAAAAEKLPAQLSGGMQKRVAVARAMILESEILIYDEPTTGLDPITTEMVDSYRDTRGTSAHRSSGHGGVHPGVEGQHGLRRRRTFGFRPLRVAESAAGPRVPRCRTPFRPRPFELTMKP